ncbi:MAG: hypothetical protein KGM95_09475, partial [Betaproteobacteria bacterium]|nr:hypothetical protein [Betaproteobacteria bacterium]
MQQLLGVPTHGQQIGPSGNTQLWLENVCTLCAIHIYNATLTRFISIGPSQMSHHQKTLERFYSLDVLRGIAALSVVLWHWQHFFVGKNHEALVVANLPLSYWAFPL